MIAALIALSCPKRRVRKAPREAWLVAFELSRLDHGCANARVILTPLVIKAQCSAVATHCPWLLKAYWTYPPFLHASLLGGCRVVLVTGGGGVFVGALPGVAGVVGVPVSGVAGVVCGGLTAVVVGGRGEVGRGRGLGGG